MNAQSAVDRRIHPEGVEPPTYGAEVRCSIQLSYGCISSGGAPQRPTRAKRGLWPFDTGGASGFEEDLQEGGELLGDVTRHNRVRADALIDLSGERSDIRATWS